MEEPRPIGRGFFVPARICNPDDGDPHRVTASLTRVR
jgi:hypothetical protein